MKWTVCILLCVHAMLSILYITCLWLIYHLRNWVWGQATVLFFSMTNLPKITFWFPMKYFIMIWYRSCQQLKFFVLWHSRNHKNFPYAHPLPIPNLFSMLWLLPWLQSDFFVCWKLIVSVHGALTAELWVDFCLLTLVLLTVLPISFWHSFARPSSLISHECSILLHSHNQRGFSSSLSPPPLSPMPINSQQFL